MATHREDEADLHVDVLAALVAALFLTTTTPLALRDEGPLSWWTYPACAAAGLAFAIRRRHPVWTVAIAVVAVAVFTIANGRGGPIFAAAFVALAWLGHARPAPRGWLPATLAAVAVLTIVSLAATGPSIHIAPIGLLLLAAPKISADRARARSLRAAASEQETGRRVAEERLRIAREVHDVVGHGLATIALRAGVADHVMTKDPAEAQEALRAIRGIARDSLTELSALLGELRADAEHAPVPDLDQLPRLVTGLREAGMDVELAVDGVEDPLPEVVGAAGYRIVQEALTNVARHAGANARARVKLTKDTRQVVVEVVDDGRGASVVRDGGGMTGMRERASALGGTFEAGDARGGGFRVRATLPAVPR